MNTPDFSKINGYHKGQRDSFEELVCQLARREVPADGAVFRRVDGAGGDGGVEAYWLNADGTLSGFQAKYHLKTSEIDWAKVDNSVRQTLETHQTLTSYTIAFACRLTDKGGAKGKGKSGWETWQDHEKKWQAFATSLGREKVTFIPWTAFELNDRLSKPEAAGLRLFWFGETELTFDWFTQHVRSAVALLDERFHPEDHVDVDIQKLFEVVSRRDSAIQALAEAFSDIEIRALQVDELRQFQNETSRALIDEMVSACSEFAAISAEFSNPVEQEWGVGKWRTMTARALTSVNSARHWLRRESDAASESGEPNKVKKLEKVSKALFRQVQALESFEAQVASKYFDAETARVAIVRGEAGTGKSHLFGHEAEYAISQRQPTLLLLGQQFSVAEPWSQITALLDLPGTSADALLGALNAAAEANRTRAILMIDGIN